ncbi:RloB family protein [Streptomyces sp. NRRL F-7442]|uniref:RloB family protein n=1 Tax=Streptomyces sp. NRRL F-7442 TaxID=1519498 RepID=UPI0006B0299D|nr:RloB family protein [Streptomyces sp. NRRL F-7442]KOX51148.1 hypothetical protein ADL09_05370 [Streptomyces sp. NRRL F-7442]
MSSRRRSKKDAASTVMPPQAPPAQFSRRERVLYVGCEGEVTEYDYLRYLNKQYGSGDSETGRPAFTIKPVRKADGLIPSRAVKAVVDAARGEDETWVLFDRDSHHDIPEAFEAAAASDTEVCFSHPSFELWLLLHFQPFGGAQGAAKNTHVLEKLRKADPAYKRFDKPDKGLDAARTKALKGKEEAAVQRARALVGQCEYGACKAANYTVEAPKYGRSDKERAARSGHAKNCDVLSRDPSTDVWRLLVSLGIVKV